MSTTLTIRIPEELAEWLENAARQTGVPVSRLVRAELERARAEREKRPFLALAGKFVGSPDMSSRKGYSRK